MVPLLSVGLLLAQESAREARQALPRVTQVALRAQAMTLLQAIQQLE